MSSSRFWLKAALSGALLASAQTVLAATPLTCSGTQQLSCQNTTAVSNLCCFNAPGGQILQTQFWDTSPSTGPSNSWTIHGLWPDHCDGTFDATCDSARQYTGINSILTSFGKASTLSYMQTYWKDVNGNDETFWEHEWGKHGTCISTLKTSCYSSYTKGAEAADFFEKTVNLFKTLPSYDWLAAAGITPSSSKTYTSAAIQKALSDQHGHEVTLGCSGSTLNEIWYHFHVQGSVVTGTFVAADPVGSSTCPSTGVKYLPKSGAAATATATGTKTATATAPGSTSTGGSETFSGSGYLNVATGGSTKGCLISAGTWYSSGTCATFTATTSGDGFTLSTSKGKCAVSSSTLSCGSSVITATVFTASGGNLAYDGSTTFYADSVPSGSTQATVYTGSHTTSLTISWQSV